MLSHAGAQHRGITMELPFVQVIPWHYPDASVQEYGHKMEPPWLQALLAEC